MPLCWICSSCCICFGNSLISPRQMWFILQYNKQHLWHTWFLFWSAADALLMTCNFLHGGGACYIDVWVWGLESVATLSYSYSNVRKWDCGGTDPLTMVLKQCRSRLTVFGVNPPEKWTSPSVPCIITPTSRSFENPIWRRRRPPGLNIMCLCELKLMSARGNKLS